jgi:hypothetical protein
MEEWKRIAASIIHHFYSACSWRVCEQSKYERALRFVAQALLVPMRLHALATLMLGNFSFPSFLK